MKRGQPLKRTPLKRGDSQLKRGGRLNPMSAKTRDRIPERAAVRAEVLARDADCYGKTRVPEVACRGEHYVHEVAQRSVCTGSQYDSSLAVRICPAHDEWLESHIAEAHNRGLLVHSWDVPGRSAIR